MISLEDAQKHSFASSTVEELRAYCDELGLAHDKRNKSAGLITMLCRELGINEPNNFAGHKANVVSVKAKGDITPDYNLTPNGRWGGRRHRVRLIRPQDTKIEAGKMFNWNGKDFGIAYDEVTNVPEPFYQILVGTRKKYARGVSVDIGEGAKEIHTHFFDAGEAFPFQYLGVDPETADRAGSLLEWYQQKGPRWFHERNRRDLERISGLCDVDLKDKHGDRLDEAALRDALLVFFFSYADAEAA